MKCIISFFVLLFSCLNVFAQSATEYFSVGNPITYCGSDHFLTWSSHPQENYYIQEYLPEGESTDHYDQMFTVSIIFWDRTPKEAVEAKIAELEQRKKTDPVTNYILAENGNEYMLEFIVSDSDIKKNTMNIAEVNLHHYKQMKINGRNASVLSFYSKRAYGDDILPFIASIPDKRGAWYEGMIKLNLKPKFK